MVFEFEIQTEENEMYALREDSESDVDSSDVEDDYGAEEEDGGGEDEESLDGEEDDNEEDVEEEENEDDDKEQDVSANEETIEASSEDLTDDEETNNMGREEEEQEDTLMEYNSGWADAMNKVLAMGKNSDKPVSVLSKAKKDNVKNKKPEEMKEKKGGDASDTGSEEEEDEKPHIPVSVRRAKKREIDSVCRVKPDITRRAVEKTFSKVATRGVVQLFNAVREQQKNVKSTLREASNTWKREKILKNLDKDGFLAVLDGKRPTEGPVSKRPKTEVKEEDEDTANWSALKEDYMLGAKMKDWDKESDEEQ